MSTLADNNTGEQNDNHVPTNTFQDTFEDDEFMQQESLKQKSTHTQQDEEADFADESEVEDNDDTQLNNVQNEAEQDDGVQNEPRVDFGSRTWNDATNTPSDDESHIAMVLRLAAQCTWHLCVLLVSGLFYSSVALSIVCTDCVCGIYRLSQSVIGNKDLWTTINKFRNQTTLSNTVGWIQETAGPQLHATSLCIINTASATKNMIKRAAIYDKAYKVACEFVGKAKEVLVKFIFWPKA